MRPLVWLAVAFAGGIFISQFFSGKTSWLIIVLVLLLIANAWFWLRNPRLFFGGFLLFFLVFGSFWAKINTPLPPQPLYQVAGNSGCLVGQVVTDPSISPERVVLLLQAASFSALPDQAVSGLVRVTLYSEAGQNPTAADGTNKPFPKVVYGDVVKVCGKLKTPEPPSNPGEFDFARYLARQGIFLQMSAASDQLTNLGPAPANRLFRLAYQLKNRLADTVSTTLPAEAAGIINGMVFGEREALSPEQQEIYQNLGLMHLFAVSGFHITILIFSLIPLINIFTLRREPVFLVVAAVLLFYGGMIGFPPSVVRAIAMGLLGLAALMFGREREFYTALAAAGILLLLLNPFYLWDIGFQLSFAATWGIVYFYPLLDSLLTGLPRWRGLLVVPLAAQLAVLPLIAYYFNLVSPISLPGNLIASGLAGILLPLAFVSLPLLIFIRPVGELLLYGCGGLATLLNFILSYLSQIPGGFFPVPTPATYLILCYYALLVILREGWYQPLFDRARAYPRQAVALVLAVSLGMFSYLWLTGDKDRLQVVFLDVGQGDACLITTPRGKNILVDGGGDPAGRFDPGRSTVLPYLRRRGITHLDVVINTHPHADHLQGLLTVVRELPVELLLLPEEDRELTDLAKQVKIRVAYPAAGDSLKVEEEITLRFINPEHGQGFPGKTDQSEVNNSSLVFTLSYGETDFLFTGDIEDEAMAEIVRKLSHQELQANILKVAHHGSKYSLNQEFLAGVNPKVAVISVGFNSFGHPSPEVLKYFKEHGTLIYRTDQHGAVTVTTDGKTYRVQTMRVGSQGNWP